MTIMSMRREGETAEPSGADAAWERLRTVTLDRRHLTRHRVIAADRVDPAHVAFDVLRTRLLQTLRARGWRRVAITSPTQGCGKTFVAANLAFSLSRRASCRTVLLDLDLRIPSLAAVLGVAPGRVALHRGARSRSKVFAVDGVSVASATAALERAVDAVDRS